MPQRDCVRSSALAKPVYWTASSVSASGPHYRQRCLLARAGVRLCCSGPLSRLVRSCLSVRHFPPHSSTFPNTPKADPRMCCGRTRTIPLRPRIQPPVRHGTEFIYLGRTALSVTGPVTGTTASRSCGRRANTAPPRTSQGCWPRWLTGSWAIRRKLAAGMIGPCSGRKRTSETMKNSAASRPKPGFCLSRRTRKPRKIPRQRPANANLRILGRSRCAWGARGVAEPSCRRPIQTSVKGYFSSTQ